MQTDVTYIGFLIEPVVQIARQLLELVRRRREKEEMIDRVQNRSECLMDRQICMERRSIICERPTSITPLNLSAQIS